MYRVGLSSTMLPHHMLAPSDDDRRRHPASAEVAVVGQGEAARLDGSKTVGKLARVNDEGLGADTKLSMGEARGMGEGRVHRVLQCEKTRKAGPLGPTY